MKSDSPGNTLSDPIVRYTLRSVRAGVLASYFMLAVLAIYVFFPGSSADDNRAGSGVLLLIALLITTMVAILPWRRIVVARRGLPVIYSWAITMLAVVDIAIAFTGGASSDLYVILVVMPVFLSGATYPVRAQVALNATSIAGYLVTVLIVSGTDLSTARIALRLGMMAASGLAVGALSNELGHHFTRQLREQVATAKRVNLWSQVALLGRRMDVLDVDGVLDAVANGLDILDFETSNVCSLDPGGQVWNARASRNHEDSFVAEPHPASLGLVGMVLDQRRTVVVDDYATIPSPIPSMVEAGFRTAIAGPIWSNGKLVGVLVGATRRSRKVRTDEIAAFELLAAQAGRAIENAELLERRRAEAERYRELLDAAPDAVVIADAETGAVLQINRQAETLFGYTADEIVGRPARTLVAERALDRELSLIEEWLQSSGQLEIGQDRPVFCVRKDGMEIPVEVTFSTVDTPDGRLVSAAVRDTSQRQEFERRLAHQATHDPLTALPNRAMFVQQLSRILKRRLSADPPIAVLLLDLDNFKYLNDSRGHSVGDNLVVEVATRLASKARGHFVARVGGDEFGILVEGLHGRVNAEAFARRLLTVFDDAIAVEETASYITASVGVAFGQASDSADALMGNADAAVNLAKRNGRDRIEFFDESLRAAAAARVATGADLHRALRDDELWLAYQPVVSLSDNRLVGVEALVRWEHPTRGTIPPLEFIPVAEDSGLIVEVGRWVLREACRQLAEWRDRHPGLPEFSMSINVSGRQLDHDQFVADVSDVLASSGVPPGLVILEITESIFIRDMHAVLRRLDALHALGVRLAIDDFGTGFSSLFSLSRLPVDVVKIDKSFIDGLGSRYDAVVGAVVSMAEAFNLQVVAEGIERQEQSDRLVDLGCRYAQGFLFSKPLRAQDAELVLSMPST